MPRTRTLARPTERDATLALRIGERIREARHRSGMTQQQLAGDRYTKAYISALETGIARPSMVALTYLCARLGVPASHFLDEQNPAWSRLQVDMHLAAGDWQDAVDGYRILLDGSLEEPARAEVLRGLAEAEARLDHGREAIAAGAEAARIFSDLGRPADEALARYWMAFGLYESDNEADARGLLSALLERVRAGLAVEPDFELRVLLALAAVESRAGMYNRSLSYLEEARGLAADLDDRRRATFLFSLAISYRETGDVEAAIRTGTQSLALYRSAGAVLEGAGIENDLALAYLASGNIAKAGEMAGQARSQAEAAGDERLLAAILETEAQVAAAHGDRGAAQELADRSADLARRTGNRLALMAAVLTGARLERDAGNAAAAEKRFAEAAELAREGGSSGRIREVLREWADLKADAGDHRGAYELTREALSVN
ncbi:MAG: helix-turn-helix transcriptional regulator [Chloroflexota bacterium]|nr:helix-turn-helix transcriptional regulator [Chloroflexota bacterium]